MDYARTPQDRPHRLPLADCAIYRSNTGISVCAKPGCDEVASEKEAIPYDVPGVEFTHVGKLCSFDAFLKKYNLVDPALQQLAEIVRGADTSRLDLTPQSAGLYAISLGLSQSFPDDHEMLRHGMVMYDGLYAWCRYCQAETHNWPPAMKQPV